MGAQSVLAYDEFDTRRSPVPKTLRSWAEASSRMLVPLRITGRQSVVQGNMTMHQRDEARFCALHATAHVARRTPELASGFGSDKVKFALNLGGHIGLRQHGRLAMLQRGDIALYDTSDPYDVGSEMPFGILVTLMPRDALSVSHDQIAATAATALRSPLLDQLRTAMVAESRGRPLMSVDQLADLASRVVADTPRHRLPASTEHAVIVERAQAYIEEHLDDPALEPTRVAVVVGVSRRRLYDAFAAEVGPVARYVRARRIDRACTLLLDVERPYLSVSDVAQMCGFEDPAHFSRVFSRALGVPPRVYRERGLAG